MDLLEPSAKKSKKSKTFQHQWFDDHPQWKTWVKECPSDSTKFHCLACNLILFCGRSEIDRHSKSVSHSKMMNSFIISADLSNVSPSPSSSSDLDFNERVQAAEIRLAHFLAENNIPLLIAPLMLNLFQTIGQEPAVLQKMTLGKTKATGVVNHVVSVHHSQQIVKDLQETKYSAFIDETTDNTNDKWMTLMVRYVAPDSLIVKTELIELIEVDATNCSGEHLSEQFTNALVKQGIHLDNFIGLACDNASVMIGKNNSFKTHTTKVVPDLLTFPCICHSLALVAKNACTAIPENILDFMSKIPTFTNGSPKRLAEFRTFQRAYYEHPSNLLRFAPTRWLSRRIVITRILENWEAIYGFMVDQASENVATADSFLEVMNDPMTKAYLIFLKFALSSLESVNSYFQVHKTLVNELQPFSKKLLVEYLQRFLNPHLLDPVIFEARNIDFNFSGNQLDLADVDVGYECRDYLKDQLNLFGVPESIVNQFRYNCLQFLILAAENIRKRLPFDDEFFSNLTVFSKELALLDSDRESSISKVQYVFRKLRVSEELIQEEWRSLYCVNPTLKEQWCKLSFDNMWTEICTLTTSDNVVQFPMMRSLLSAVRALPHSNAAAERAFSLIPDIKTKKRNNLSPETLNSLCVIRSSSKSSHLTAVEMSIDKNLVGMMSSRNLYCEKEKTQSEVMNVHAFDSGDDWEMDES
ncbi:zinc finger protein 862-like [Cotesia typhae]|uniref:zinc finger protein 862-like n=1 Tax=Cotesia typhae TaxID=2053667 RepID=UPI003D69A0F4